jgi:hypothetical protein
MHTLKSVLALVFICLAPSCHHEANSVETKDISGIVPGMSSENVFSQIGKPNFLHKAGPSTERWIYYPDLNQPTSGRLKGGLQILLENNVVVSVKPTMMTKTTTGH